MNEYISKQSVLDYLNGYLHSIGEYNLLLDIGQRRALTNTIQDISAVKAANVQPVKHGRWDGYICSECNVCADYFISGDFYFDEKPNFCPNCGAKMDGKQKGEVE